MYWDKALNSVGTQGPNSGCWKCLRESVAENLFRWDENVCAYLKINNNLIFQGSFSKKPIKANSGLLV